MRWIRQQFYFWYMRYKVWQFTRAMRLLIRFGTVRQIKWAALKIREIGEQRHIPECKQLAEVMDGNAERVILRRVFRKRV